MPQSRDIILIEVCYREAQIVIVPLQVAILNRELFEVAQFQVLLNVRIEAAFKKSLEINCYGSAISE